MDLYKILGVSKDATLAEIKKAYRKQSAKHHPDHGGEAKAFAELSLAYEVLSDSGKREQYDSCGSIPGMDPSPVVKIIHDSVLDVSANQVRDFVQSVRDVISSKRKKFVTQKDATNKAIEQIAKRIKTIKGGSDQGRSIMANVLEQHMAAGKQYLAHTESIIGHHDEAIELLEGVKCDDDLAWVSAGIQFRTASSWGTNPADW